jgi:hypothetical protein
MRASDCRPDRFRMIDDHAPRTHRIARGGGYSYAAASFGVGSLVLDMTRFNRLLRIEPASRRVEVEAGMTLGTDGDDQYEIEDFRKLLKLRDRCELIIAFRHKKIYSSLRIFISWVYNRLLRLLFRTPFRDVSTGLRMVRRSVLEDRVLEAQQPVHRSGAGDQGHAEGLPGGRGRHPDLSPAVRLGSSTSLTSSPPWPTCGGSTARPSQTPTTFPPGGRAPSAHGSSSSLGGSSVDGS